MKEPAELIKSVSIENVNIANLRSHSHPFQISISSFIKNKYMNITF